MTHSFENRVVVVGSGPSAISVCAVLIKNGVRPIVLDSAIDSLTEKISKFEFVNNKTWFESAQSYARHPRSKLEIDSEYLFRGSYTFGGLSRVWGATSNFFRDFQDWPQDCIPKNEDFEFIQEILEPSQTCFTNFSSENSLHGDARSGHLFQLASKKIPYQINPSILAIQTNETAQNRCGYFGKCITGCPKDAIWFAGNQILSWQKEDKIDYIPGVFIERVEQPNYFWANCLCCTTNDVIKYAAKRIFICCGLFPSTEIALNSGLAKKLEIKDTSTLFMGALSFKSFRNYDGKSHNLSQWVIKHPKSKFCAQLYAPSEDNKPRLRSALPKFLLNESFVHKLNNRLFPIIFYLNPSDSEGIFISKTLQTLYVSAEKSVFKKVKLSLALLQFSIQLLKIGLVVPIFAVRFTPPGSGFHSGGSLAMGAITDSLGRLPEYERVHFVDASTLPNIEVGSITPTIMANASRIARMSLTLEEEFQQ